MAVQPFKFYNLALKKIGNNTLSLASTVFRVSLYGSASNAATRTLSTLQSLTSEVTEANGYSSSGKALANENWTVGASAKLYRMDADDQFWSANGGAISGIKFLVIWLSGASANARHLVAFCSLSSSQFNLSSGNRMTIQFNSAGLLQMSTT